MEHFAPLKLRATEPMQLAKEHDGRFRAFFGGKAHAVNLGCLSYLQPCHVLSFAQVLLYPFPCFLARHQPNSKTSCQKAQDFGPCALFSDISCRQSLDRINAWSKHRDLPQASNPRAALCAHRVRGVVPSKKEGRSSREPE